MNRLKPLGAALGLILLVACGAQEPAETEVKFAEGRQLLEQGAWEEAQAYFEGQIAATPEDPEVHFLAGQAAAMGANYPEAEGHFVKALELQPETSAYYDWIGRIYGAKARIGGLLDQMQAAPKIKENFEKAVELDPGNLEAKFFLGTFYVVAPAMAGGDRAKGKAIADELVSEAPLSGHRLLAQFYAAERNLAEAEKAYQEALTLAPDEPQSHSDLAALYLSQKEIEKAVEHLDKALELDADHQASLMTYGELALRSADHREKGIASVEKLIAMDRDIQSPNPGTARYTLAALYEKEERMDDALAMYQQAGEMGSPQAAKRLKEMEAEAQAPASDEATTATTEAEAPAPAEMEAGAESADEAPAEGESAASETPEEAPAAEEAVDAGTPEEAPAE